MMRSREAQRWIWEFYRSSLARIRSFRRRALQPRLPEPVEEPAKTRDREPAFLAPEFEVGLISIERRLRGQALRISDRPRLDREVRDTRENGSCRARRAASGDSDE